MIPLVRQFEAVCSVSGMRDNQSSRYGILNGKYGSFELIAEGPAKMLHTLPALEILENILKTEGDQKSIWINGLLKIKEYDLVMARADLKPSFQAQWAYVLQEAGIKEEFLPPSAPDPYYA